jgi:hypothetical protein
MEKENFKLTVLEFTAFDSDGKKYFIADLSDENGDGKVVIKDNETTVEKTIESLKHLCNTVVIHKVTEYDLSVLGKKETILNQKFEPKKHIQNVAA